MAKTMNEIEIYPPKVEEVQNVAQAIRGYMRSNAELIRRIRADAINSGSEGTQIRGRRTGDGWEYLPSYVYYTPALGGGTNRIPIAGYDARNDTVGFGDVLGNPRYEAVDRRWKM